MIDSSPSNSYRLYTISDYFKRMSNGNTNLRFDFIGDIHPNIITVQPDVKWDSANVLVINELNRQAVDFRKYDNWYFHNGAFHFLERNGDGFLDMLIIIYRGGSSLELPGGVSTLGFFDDITTHDGIKIRSGVSVKASGITTNTRGEWKNAFYLTAHLAHEYGHYLYEFSHTAMGGLMMGAPWAYHGTYAMSAWERELLGYIDIPSAYNGQTKTLRDYVTTGDALRVNIAANEYFIIENHQRLNYFDQIIRGGALQGALDPNAQLGKGIYIWYVNDTSKYYPHIWSIQADGGFDWQFVEWRVMTDWGGSTVAVLDRGNVYRYLPKSTSRDTIEIGKCDRNNLHFYVPSLSEWREDVRWWDKDPLTKNWIISRDAMGDETDAFNVNAVNQITPWSNPSTTKLIGGNPSPTNISIKLVSQSGSDIIVQVFTSESGGLSLPPSKPQNLKVNNVNNFAQITWEVNLEPDMQYSGKYKIYRISTSGGEPTTFWYVATINAYNGTTPVTTWTDQDPYVGTGTDKLFYRITAVDNGNSESVPSDYDWVYWDQNMQKFAIKTYNYDLRQNYPNPFNPTTKIKYSIRKTGLVTLKIYDLLSREVAMLVNEQKEAGEYEVEFNADKYSISSGVFLYQLRSSSFNQTKKFIYLR